MRERAVEPAAVVVLLLVHDELPELPDLARAVADAVPNVSSMRIVLLRADVVRAVELAVAVLRGDHDACRRARTIFACCRSRRRPSSCARCRAGRRRTSASRRRCPLSCRTRRAAAPSGASCFQWPSFCAGGVLARLRRSRRRRSDAPTRRRACRPCSCRSIAIDPSGNSVTNGPWRVPSGACTQTRRLRSGRRARSACPASHASFGGARRVGHARRRRAATAITCVASVRGPCGLLLADRSVEPHAPTAVKTTATCTDDARPHCDMNSPDANLHYSDA